MFNPHHNNRKFNTETCTVLIQMLYAVHEVSIQECYRQKLPLDENVREFDKFKSKGGKLSCCGIFCRSRGCQKSKIRVSPQNGICG